MAYAKKSTNRSKASTGERTVFSTAKAGTDKKGRPYVRGARLLGGVMVSYFASPWGKGLTLNYHGTKANGQEYNLENWALKVSSPATGSSTVPCIYDKISRKIFAKEVNICLSPSKDWSGPYLGKQS
jgi:hypothetical protein